MKHRKTPPSALTDIAFLLLFFFLLLAITTEQLPVEITPALLSESRQAEEDLPLVIADAQGRIWNRQEELSLEDIPPGREYMLLADGSTRFGAIYPVIEHLRESGTETLHCVVEER